MPNGRENPPTPRRDANRRPAQTASGPGKCSFSASRLLIELPPVGPEVFFRHVCDCEMDSPAAEERRKRNVSVKIDIVRLINSAHPRPGRRLPDRIDETICCGEMLPREGFQLGNIVL